jgi:hypothetical protein
VNLKGSPRAFVLKNQWLADNKARTEALWSGIEKTQVSAHGIEWYGTLMAHLLGVMECRAFSVAMNLAQHRT